MPVAVCKRRSSSCVGPGAVAAPLQLDGQELLQRPYKERRVLLEALFTDHALRGPWTLCPMTTDLAKAREWLESWTDVSGVEGLVIKPLTSRHLTGYRRWTNGPPQGHHRSDRRRYHGHADPPRAPGPRPLRRGGPVARGGSDGPAAPGGVPTGGRASRRGRPRTPARGGAVQGGVGEW
ncbi:hypothetical protein ABZY44_32560 [Streptomyces sp. NPDC006544]|uniref:ATP-dependent DNA ligase n=1 Tax=Streptomyces sp. NPDC006544 TaxID=3154583 RepID=UPI0033B0152B